MSAYAPVLECRVIAGYEKDVATVLGLLSSHTLDTAVELLSLPDRIRGYGPVKEKAMQAATIRYEVECLPLVGSLWGGLSHMMKLKRASCGLRDFET